MAQYLSSLFLPKHDNRLVEVDAEQHIYRNKIAEHELIKGPKVPECSENDRTIGHIWRYITDTNADKPGFGERELLEMHVEEKPATDGSGKTKKWYTPELSDTYKWITYGEARKWSDSVTAYLLEKGIQPGDSILLYAKTSQWWMITAMACFAAGIIVTTAYDSMPADDVLHVLKETGSKVVLTEISLIGTFEKVLKGSPEGQVQIVLYSGKEIENKKQLEQFLSSVPKGISVDHVKEVMSEGHTSSKLASSEPSTNDLAMIMYTSGSTGNPKGVEMTHGNMVAAQSAGDFLARDIVADDEHYYIAFLPLAHVLEFLLEFMFINLTVPIGYASIRTLMEDGVVGKDGQGKGKGDLSALRPTIMCGVPAVWERIRKGIESKVAKQNPILQTIFNVAINVKWQLLKFFGKNNVITDIFNKTIFAPIRAVTGGRLQYGVTGGAPVSFETHRFVNTTLCQLLEGYGLTECCGLGAVTLPWMGATTTGTIGYPSPSIEFRFVDVEDAGYKASEGVGEIWLRGPSLLKGYHKRPDVNKESLTDDGWFKTGDVGKINPDGTISITDRIKNLVKLSHGEYIAIESLESKYRNCQEIKSICIVAENGKDFILAVVEPSSSNADKDQLLKALQKTARDAGCSRVETIHDIFLSNEDWSKNGYMTTSGKLKRNVIKDAYKDDIKKAYGQK
ncbi:hypothetical protein K450DRAFT_243877 [Umbelopsis ramanniana AG]|uniref:AMP-dependent synthetase/ligase domain-containing protein n=1 Tax=Umbelopsis ramanniana AG TaxID=1314678 RepID=A0AAD5E7Y0_UMBRA|nr:uncharacterized protein K450DRAFT_243877 [Umbelopsis ramanniana AG]KAI8579103.1 hypothetical protein K450DRAFT_243877 [Umbelopsis ramanniana AG]